jgi:uncharacterized protein (DUF1501 family)
MSKAMKTTRVTQLGAASRREFLKRGSALSAIGAAAPWALNLAAIGEAAAESASDYKALVCVFLSGGNDHGNTLVPYDEATHAQYSALRGALATPRSALAGSLLAPATALTGGRQFALAPQLLPLVDLFNNGAMAPLLNIGPLMQPTTKAQYLAKSVPLPPKLFSHNDQQSVWQASLPEGATSGWGGRMGDLFMSGNGQSAFTAVSVSGNAVYLSGRDVAQYQVSSSGSVAINGIGASLYGSSAAAQALRTLITTAPANHAMQRAHVAVTQRSISADATLRSALTASPPPATVFPTTGLGKQLQMVAKIIAARGALGVKRQVFFVSLGGFDLHDALLAKHPVLLTTVADAMAAFYKATVDMGIAPQVTAFTASDFGRTLSSNGDGSDHGWGSHHFAVGGALKARSFIGAAPLLGDNGDNDVGQGRMLPTMAVDQLAATFATWMGVAAGDLAGVLPGIVEYTQKDVGLFA